MEGASAFGNISDPTTYSFIMFFASVFFSVVITLLLSPIKKPPGPLEERINSLTTALKESVKLIDTIQSEIDSKQQLADRLQKDIAIADNLIKLKKPEVEAITQVLRTELDAQEKKSFYKDVAINAGFFLAGAVVSVITTVLLK